MMAEAKRGPVIVTGASGGLGHALVGRLLAAGHHVVAACRTCPAALTTLLEGHPGRADHVPLDLARPDAFPAFTRGIVERHGHPYALVNNAAVAHDGVLATMHDRQISEMIQVNLVSALLLTKQVLRPMLIARRGRIVNVASIIAATGYSGLSVYGATKAAMLGFTRSLAREVGRAGITVNAVAPGYMETAMTAGMGLAQLETIRRRSALRELARPEDIAAAVAYLLGPDGARITGAVFTIDAGATA